MSFLCGGPRMALGHRTRAVIGSISAAAAFGALLTGCSASSDETGGAAEQVQVDPELRALLPGGLLAESTRIAVGTESGYPPFEYTNEAGRIVGFEIDLFDAASDRLGLKYT